MGDLIDIKDKKYHLFLSMYQKIRELRKNNVEVACWSIKAFDNKKSDYDFSIDIFADEANFPDAGQISSIQDPYNKQDYSYYRLNFKSKNEN